MTTFLFWADSVELMSQMKDDLFDCIFADPPYGTGNLTDKTPTYDKSDYMASRRWSAFNAPWDGPIDVGFTQSWLWEAQRILKPEGTIWICGTHHNIPVTALFMQDMGWYTLSWTPWIIVNSMPHLAQQRMASANQTLIWARSSPAVRHFYNYERAKSHNGGKNLRDFWRLDGEENYYHELNEKWFVVPNSTQAVKEMPALKEFKAKKPYKLVARCLDISLPDDRETLVLDPFLGSGTTAVVASRINEFVPLERKYPIHCVGIEKSMANIKTFIEPRLGVTAVAGPGGAE